MRSTCCAPARFPFTRWYAFVDSTVVARFPGYSISALALAPESGANRKYLVASRMQWRLPNQGPAGIHFLNTFHRAMQIRTLRHSLLVDRVTRRSRSPIGFFPCQTTHSSSVQIALTPIQLPSVASTALEHMPAHIVWPRRQHGFRCDTSARDRSAIAHLRERY